MSNDGLFHRGEWNTSEKHVYDVCIESISKGSVSVFATCNASMHLWGHRYGNKDEGEEEETNDERWVKGEAGGLA